MDCPRCGTPLQERGPNRQWLQFFECGQCWLAFEVNVERHFEPCSSDPQAKFLRHIWTLQPGRTPRPAGSMR